MSLNRLKEKLALLGRFLKSVWEKIRLVDWSVFLTATYKAIKKEDLRIDPKYIVIKPRALSDHNLLRCVNALRAVLSVIPATAIGAPILSLGEMGFNIFKHISLQAEFSQLKFPPIDPNTLRVSIQIDPELNKHFGYMIAPHNWNSATLRELEPIYNDFSFITSWELLQAKYPQVSESYVKARAAQNLDYLQTALYQIEQEIVKHSHVPEVQHNLKDALEALKQLFPVMRDWALFNSEGFNEILELIDIAV